MRPGLVFLALFAVLVAVYAALADTLGTQLTFLLQGVIVVVILAAALWVRRHTRQRIQETQDELPAEQDFGSGGRPPHE